MDREFTCLLAVAAAVATSVPATPVPTSAPAAAIAAALATATLATLRVRLESLHLCRLRGHNLYVQPRHHVHRRAAPRQRRLLGNTLGLCPGLGDILR